MLFRSYQGKYLNGYCSQYYEMVIMVASEFFRVPKGPYRVRNIFLTAFLPPPVSSFVYRIVDLDNRHSRSALLNFSPTCAASISPCVSFFILFFGNFRDNFNTHVGLSPYSLCRVRFP